MKVLVCGGRDFNNSRFLFQELDKIHMEDRITTIIHGGALGADYMAGKWAEKTNIQQEVYAADWKKHGPAAGPIRNQLMLNNSQPDIVVAFPGGKGTADMVKRAQKANIKVISCNPQQNSVR